jgi:phosphatidylserine/phosphatidylglycerophosphate/cardiolipin synthase-like enzyme
MKPDDAALVFADKLMEAADRGVRVRFLLEAIQGMSKMAYRLKLDEKDKVTWHGMIDGRRLWKPRSRKLLLGAGSLHGF